MKKRKGFTLLELLLVIAILVVLVALVAPNIFSKGQKAMADSRYSTFAANYGMILTAVHMVEWRYPSKTDTADPYFWVDWNNDGTWADSEKLKAGAWKADSSFLGALVNKGYLTPEACKFENKDGAAKYFILSYASEEFNTDEKLKFDLWPGTSDTDTSVSGDGIRKQTVTGTTTLRQIWENL